MPDLTRLTTEEELALFGQAVLPEATALAGQIAALFKALPNNNAMTLAAFFAVIEVAGLVLSIMEDNNVPGGVAVAERFMHKQIRAAFESYQSARDEGRANA
jgi:hypothetical protein